MKDTKGRKKFIKYSYYENNIQIKKLREELMDQDPHCYWCGIEVIYYLLRKHEKFPDNFATIDHLYSRLNPTKRYRIYENGENKVLACFKCNNSRANEFVRTIPKELRAKREKLLQLRKKYNPTLPRPIAVKDINSLIENL